MENQTSNPNNNNVPMAIIVAGALIATGVYLGLSGGKLPIGGNNQNNNIAVVTPGVANNNNAVQGATVVKVSVDDDPVMGKADAPVTIIEFSDYECPFCKRNFEQTMPSIKKDYVDTGKAKYVFRDLPLSFHDPMATKEAVAANCARELAKDDGYWKFHDETYKRTTSNGTGLTVDNLYQIAADLKLNAANFKKCLDADKYKDEIQKDINDGNIVGATGTPTFFVGKSSANGTIDGEMIVGAVPYASMKAIIDKYLQ